MRWRHLQFVLPVLLIVVALGGLVGGLQALDGFSQAVQNGMPLEPNDSAMTPSDQEKWEETVKPYYKIWTEIDRNFGVAVWSFGLSLVWVLYFSYLKRVVLKSDFFSASVLALSLVACIFIGAVDYVVTDAHRGLLPWWGDTLALPIGSALIMSLVLSPVFVLSAFLVVKQASHQSPKWWNFLLIGVGALPFVLILLVTWDSPSWGVTGAYSVLVFLLLISPARRPKSLGGAT